MSDKSASQSSNGSAASLKRCVEQILIESDEEEKNIRKLNSLKNQFPVLKKISPMTTNNQKLQLFLKDNHFRQKIQQKMMENKIHLEEGIPILKIYLVSTRYNSQIQEEFQETDLFYVFQKFGHILHLSSTQKFAYLFYQQISSVYVCMKVMNEFPINEKIRLRVRLAYDEQLLQAHTLFYHKQRGGVGINYEPGCPTESFASKCATNQLKYIAKFEFGVQNLPQFNIAQRIIGPKGSYMKKIIQKMLSRHPLAHKYNLSNIDGVFKMRIRGKGSRFLESGQESDQKMHLFVSTKEKWMYEAACQEVEILLIKVFQDYKVAFQKVFRRHAAGIAYIILQYEGNYYTEIRRVYLEEIEEAVDLISLESQGKLSDKIINEKIQQREQARKNGKFQEADQIRNWLKSRGVALVDSKIKCGKTTWNYIKL